LRSPVGVLLFRARPPIVWIVSRKYTAVRIASALLVLVFAFYGVQAASPRCPTDAPCCPKQAEDQQNDELVNRRPPCCDQIAAAGISVQPTTRSESSAPLAAMVLVPTVEPAPPLLSRLSRPPVGVPLNLQLLYKRKCVLLL
jgi:hypothetical protein